MKKNMGKNKILIGECQLINVGMMELGNCHLKIVLVNNWASLMAQRVKNPSANEEHAGSIPGLGRSPGGGHSNPL